MLSTFPWALSSVLTLAAVELLPESPQPASVPIIIVVAKNMPANLRLIIIIPPQKNIP